jgi:ribosomal protein S27AE
MQKELVYKLLVKLAEQVEEVAPSGPNGKDYHLILYYSPQKSCLKCGAEGGFVMLKLKPPSYYYDEGDIENDTVVYCGKCLESIKTVEKNIWKEQMTFAKIKDDKGDWIGTVAKCWECGQSDFIYYHDDDDD